MLRAATVDRIGRLSAATTVAWVFPDCIATQQRPQGTPESFTDRGLNGTGDITFPAGFSVNAGVGFAESMRAAPVVVVSAGTQAFFGHEAGLYSRASRKSNAAEAGPINR